MENIIKTLRLVKGLFLALLVAGGVATAQDAGDSAQDRHLNAALLLFKEGKPGEAITNELNPVIAYYEGIYSNDPRKIYCARTTDETLAYMIEASSGKREAIAIGPEWAMAYYRKAYALIELGRLDEARSNLVSALKLSPCYAVALNELAYLNQMKKNMAESLSLFVRAEDCARKYSPEEVRISEITRALRGQGFHLVEQGKLDTAEAKYRECVKLNPDDKASEREIDFIQDQRILQVKCSPGGLMSEVDMAFELSPLGGILKISQTNDLSPADSDEIEALLKAAEKGDAQAQFKLGLMYGNGIGVQQDYGEAVKWFRVAAEQGHARAEYGLGVMYAEGLGVSKDGEEAVKWLRRSANQGDVRGEFGLGMAYADGFGVPKDDVEAAKWFRKAAERGDPSAQHNLGVVSGSGEVADSEPGGFVKWYLKAAEQGDPKAQTKIGHLYGGGIYLSKDPAESAKWYRRAAEQGEPFAQAALGWAYANGEGVDQNITEAVAWWKKAAENGQPKASFNLGLVYSDKRLAQHDFAEALKWFKKAATQGHGDAFYFVGKMYYQGSGVPQDPERALRWIQKAAECGNSEAVEIIQGMENK